MDEKVIQDAAEIIVLDEKQIKLLKKQYQELCEAVRPFLISFEMHKDDMPISKRKFNMALSLGLSDFERLAEVMTVHERTKSNSAG